MNSASTLKRILNAMRLQFPLVIFLAASVVSASAQTGRTLECGARIASSQPFAGGRLCLAIVDTGDRSRVGLRTCSDKTSDQAFLWKIVRRDGGGVHILAASSGQERRMEVADFNKFNGAAIQMWGPNIGDGYRSQTWDFVPTAGGTLLVNVDSGKCAAVPLGRNRLDQEFLIQHTCSRASNFTFQIEPVLTGAERDCR